MQSSSMMSPVLIFVHIPKTAGGTLNSIIRRKYDSDRVYRYEYGDEARIDFENLPVEKKNELLAIYGHLYFGIHKQLKGPCTYITILRNPIDRLISAYTFIRERPAHPNYPYAQELSFKEFVERGVMGKEQENGQTRILSGRYEEDGPCKADMLEQAKTHLKNDISVVGLTERFDESLILIKRALSWRMPFYFKKNVSHNQLTQNDLDAETLAFLRDYNRFDLQLYEYAQQLFDEQIRQQDASYARELTFFKTANRFYAIPIDVARQVKNKIRPRT